MDYTEKLGNRIREVGSALCVGLDPRRERIGGGSVGEVGEFLRRVIGETSEYAAAFKPNVAYFEAMGWEGVKMLEEVLGEVPREIPVILDAKRGDIGETQKYYAEAAFERYGADAVTLNPFMGADTLEPFLDYEGKGIYLLAVTSNPGSADIQRRRLASGEGGEWVYELVAQMTGRRGGIGLVVGLTNASGEVLGKIPDVPLLIPGLGAQGGDLGVISGQGRSAPNVVNVSRGVLFPEGGLPVKEAAREFAAQIRDQLGLAGTG